MTFLAPALLLGLLGLAGPALAHLLGRDPPTIVPFAALRFLEPQAPAVSRRRRIHDPALLALRLLLFALLVLVLARPTTESSTKLAVLAKPHDAVLLVDGSASMSVIREGRSEYARALERAEQLLSMLPADSRLGLCNSDPNGPQLELGAEALSIVDALERWLEAGPGLGADKLSSGLECANRMLSASPPGRPRVIYAIGDPTRDGLSSLPNSGEGGAKIVPISTREDGEPDPEHLGIQSVEWSRAPDLGPGALRIQVAVARHGGGENTTVDATVALRLRSPGGQEEQVAKASVTLKADDETTVEFTHTLPPDELSSEAGEAIAATVELLGQDSDAFPADDRFYLWLSARRPLTLLVVNGDPSEQRLHDEVFYVNTALAMSGLADRAKIRSLAPDQLEATAKEGGDILDEADLVLLANVPAPSPKLATRLQKRVEEGMGLWLSMGDRVDPAAYNTALAKVLPLLLRDTVLAGTTPGRSEARGVALAPAQLSHPMFAGRDQDLDLAATQTRRMALLEPDAQRQPDIALAFTNGAPALITRALGKGRVALLTTSLDRDWSDLPIRPGFVPLVERTVDFLASSRQQSDNAELFIGDVLPLPPGNWTIHRPAGPPLPLAPGEDGTSRFRDTEDPGHYWAKEQDGQIPSVFSVNVDSRESDTHADSIAKGEIEGEARQAPIQVPRWRGLVLLILALLGAESWLRSRRRRSPPP